MKIKSILRPIFDDRSGNALVLVAVTLPALIGAAGLGMDSIQWTLMQRQMQREADSAALAGAFARAQGASATTAANASLTRDGLLTLTAAPVIERPPTTGSYAGNTEAVRVALTTTSSLPFSNMFLRSPTTVKAEATAASLTNGTYCVVSLESSSATGITMQGSAVVNMGCGLATNSKGVPAVTAGGSSTITASHVAAVGGLKATANYTSGTVLLPYTVPQRDPYSSLPTPTVPSPCNAKLNVNPNNTVNVTNPTGVTCYKGMDIKGTVNLASGIYYIDGGSVSLGSQAVLNGTGVTFILTSSTAASTPSSVASLSMNGGATVNLTATTTGTYAGVLFYQDRRAPAGGSNTVNGNSSSKLQGGFYFKSQDLSFSGDSGMATDCVQLVSRRVTFTGNNSIVNTCPVNSGAHAFVGTRVYLVG
uniref:pilus assembly protein TadG-related protein n=1 Tax=Altererythrobacter segetis TaxID=1104773 RepID=UPI00140A8DFB|nr:pilus assembly protein TadG-related protein [Altererythrobacter segetis]